MRARSIQHELGYVRWENFNNVIKKCITLTRGNPEHSFKPAMSLISLPKGAFRSIKDFELNDADIDLIKKMSGYSKPTGTYKIRIENIIVSLLKKYYAAKEIDVITQFWLGQYRYDCKINNVLVEYDEDHHLNESQRIIDRLKNELATQNNYAMVRVQIEEDIVDAILKINAVLEA